MIDFPVSPSVGQNFSAAGVTWTWDGAKWTATGLNVPYLPLAGGTLTGPLTLAGNPVNPLDAATKQYSDGHAGFRNRIINGDMVVDQRNGGVQIALPSTSSYAIDRWRCSSQATTAGKANIGRVTLLYPPPIGFAYGLQLITTTAYGSPVAADTVSFSQAVEQINFQDALFGTANAQPLVVEFWVGASIAGNYGVSVCSGSAPYRSYVATFNVPTANVWTKIRLNIPGDIGGTTWSPATNGVGIFLRFALCTGSTYTTSTLNAWQDGNFVSAPGMTNVLGTNGAVFTVTGAAIMVGANAANAEPDFRKFSDNLLDCQRYFKNYPGIIVTGYSSISGNVNAQSIVFPVSMRASPTGSAPSPSYTNCSALSFASINPNLCDPSVTVTAAGMFAATTGGIGILFDADY
jgi:hypothetical protein